MPKQIGWSNESNLLYQISQQITRLINVTGTNGGSITGSGTLNYVSKWTSSSALGNSRIYDNGTNVIIGGTSPLLADDALSVYGNTRVQNLVAENSLYSRNNFFMLGGYAQLGTGTNTGERLQVFGDIKLSGNLISGNYIQTNNVYTDAVIVNRIQMNTTDLFFYNLGGTTLLMKLISSSGNLLINRTIEDGSGAKLQVNGNINTPNNISSFLNATTFTLSNNYMGYGGGDIKFIKSDYGTEFGKFFESTGNFRIGTGTDSTRKLQVVGEAEFIVTVATGAHTTSGNHLPIWVNGVKYWLALLNPVV